MCKENGNNNNNNKRELKVKLSVQSNAAKGGSVRVYRPPRVSILTPAEEELLRSLWHGLQEEAMKERARHGRQLYSPQLSAQLLRPPSNGGRLLTQILVVHPEAFPEH